MARISSPWVGIGKGKMGEGIYYERKGKIYSKQYRAHINQPKTVKHELDWGNFRVSQKICNTFKIVVKEYWKSAKEGQTDLNSLMSYTRLNALQLVGDVWEPDWEKVRLASGTLVGFKKPVTIQVVGDNLIFSWEDNSGIGGAKKDDYFVYMLLFTSLATEKIYGQVKYEKTTQIRKDESFTLEKTASINGDMRVFGCFVSAHGKKVSDSMCFGEVTL